MNNKTKRKLSAIAALLLCGSILLTGCGSNVKSKEASLKITVSSHEGASETTATGYKTTPKNPSTNKAKKIPLYSTPPSDKTYAYHCDNAVNIKDGQVIENTRFVEKYTSTERLWMVYLEEEFEAVGCIEVSDGVLTYGITYGTDDSPKLPIIVKISSDGEVLWSKIIDTDTTDSSIGIIFETEDKSYDFIGIGDSTKMFFGRLSFEGELTLSTSFEVGSISPISVIRTSKGYAMHYTSEDPARSSGIITIDNNGNFTNNFSYGSDDKNFVITSICEFEGKLCVSTYSLPKSVGSTPQKSEIANIVDKIPYSDTGTEQNRDLLYALKDLYVANLLICNYDTGAVEEFISAEGSLGGVLLVNNDGNLTWKVECLTVAYYALKTSVYTVNGSSYVYDYIFNSEFELSDVIECNYLFYFAK